MAGGLTGSLEQWPLPELLNMLGSSRQSGRVAVDGAGSEGAIFLSEGQLVHATVAMESGVAALTTLFSLHEGSFCFEPRVPAPAVTLDRPLDVLVAEVQREANERDTIRRMIPSAHAVPHLARRTPDETITLQPSEWIAIVLSDGTRSVSSLAAEAGVDTSAAMRLLYTLGQRGLLEFSAGVTEAPAPIAPERPALTLVPAPVVEAIVEPEPVLEPEPAPAPVVIVPVAPPPPSYIHTAFFQDLSLAAAATLGPLASVIVDDAVEAIGYPRDAFPRQRAPQLVEVIAREIKDDRRRAEFQATMLRILRDRAA